MSQRPPGPPRAGAGDSVRDLSGPGDSGRDLPGTGDSVRDLFEPDAASADAGSGGGSGLVLAAGTICWRTGDGGLEVLLVESARWGDWSWPKGKLEAGESLPECAVREVAEETGTRVVLGVPLPGVTYVLPDGRAKTVRYWAARVRETGRRTAPDDEIAAVEWLSVAEARERLTRPGDLAPLAELVTLHELGQLDTRPLLVVRHAKARSRSKWPGAEADRPLTATGRRQARSLAGLLACWAPERVLCSPWARCMQTLEPYLGRPDAGPPGARAPEVVPLLSEDGLEHDPERVGTAVADLLHEPGGAMLCTHRRVLEAVVQALARAGGEEVRRQLPDGDPWLSPAEVLLVHVQLHAGSDGEQRVLVRMHSVERYRGESS